LRDGDLEIFGRGYERRNETNKQIERIKTKNWRLIQNIKKYTSFGF
jgi:hypothetical protein